MERRQRRRALWVVLAVLVGLAATVAPLLAIAGSDGATFTATRFADLIRFEAEGVVSLQVRVYDLAETILWDSDVLLGDMVDWDRTDTFGERVANGLYVYHVQGWDAVGSPTLDKTGKVALLPGDQVELRSAPVPVPVRGDSAADRDEGTITQPMGLGDHPIYGSMRIGTTSGGYMLRVEGDVNGGQGVMVDNPNTGTSAYTFFTLMNDLNHALQLHIFGENYSSSSLADKARLRASGTDGLILATSDPAPIEFQIDDSTRMVLDDSGNVGIGTTNATDRLTIQGASGNLIACYPDSSRAAGAAVFRVESDGDVYADGTAYAEDFVVGGGADVAERINVSEWVEAGDVVEIDPEHIGFFRKADGAYSRRVAGIISTSPGVILGNASDPASDEWSDNRPVLAIAGRVPVKVTTENGTIAVGDLLVSSSVPGVAMKGDPSMSIGAVVGKAMESLESGEGTIMAQVTLR